MRNNLQIFVDRWFFSTNHKNIGTLYFSGNQKNFECRGSGGSRYLSTSTSGDINEKEKLPVSLLSYIKKKVVAISLMFEKFLEILLRIPILKHILLAYFLFLGMFRFVFISLEKRFSPQTIQIGVIFLITCLYRLRLSTVNVYIFAIFLTLESHRLFIGRFYRTRPELLAKHFPSSQNPKRQMHRVTHAIIEAAQNPTVQAVTIGIGGMVTWKAIDAYDNSKTRLENEKQREAESADRAKDRDAEDRRHRESLEAESADRAKDRDAEYQRHRESLEAEAAERAKDREAEYLRHRESLEAQSLDAEISSTSTSTSSTTSSSDFVD